MNVRLAKAIRKFKWLKIIKNSQNRGHGTFNPLSYLVKSFAHLKLCLADAIHNFKWVKIMQILKCCYFMCRVLSLTFSTVIFDVLIKNDFLNVIGG